MTENDKGSGAPAEEGGAQTQSDASTETKVETVLKTDHQRALDDLHKHKAGKVKAEARVKELEASAKKRDEDKLKETDDYKVLSERYATERDTAVTDLNQFKEGYFTNQKLQVVREAAIKAGIHNPDDVEMLDLTGVTVEKTDAGRVIVHGAKECIDEHKKQKPYLFTSTEVPKFNSGGAGLGDGKAPSEGKLTHAEYAEGVRKFKNHPVKAAEWNARYDKQRRAQ